MRIFIPSYNRSGRISTHLLLRDMDWTVVVHSEDQATEYRRNARIPRDRLVVSGVHTGRTGIWHQRRWICEHLAEPGEWFAFADDNIRAFHRVHPRHYDEDELPITIANCGPEHWQRRFSVPTGGDELTALWSQDAARADEMGTGLVGYATTGNPLFRTKHYREVGYVITKFALWRNDAECDWSTPVNMDDFQFTADRLFRHGRVLINQFVYPVAGHYEPGGLGPYADRVAARRESVQLLLRQYPGLFRVKNRKGFAPDTDLQLALHTTEQIDAWRRDLARSRAVPA